MLPARIVTLGRLLRESRPRDFRAGALVYAALAAIAVGWVETVRRTVAGPASYFAKYWTLNDGPVPVDRLSDLSPAYFWLVRAVRAIADHAPSSLQVAQLYLLVPLALVLFHVARRAWGNVAALSTFVFFLLNAAAFSGAFELEPEVFLFGTATASLFLLAKPDIGRKHLAGAATVLGIGACFRPVMLLVVIAFALSVVGNGETRERVRRTALFIFLSLVPLALLSCATLAAFGVAGSMNPGVVFYEGMNSGATGYAACPPMVVRDLASEIDAPDAAHVAYRQVVRHARGDRAADASVTNRYWFAKALEFALAHPAKAFALTVRKIFFALHSHEATDTWSMQLFLARSEHLPWVPFGVLVALAVLALTQFRRNMLTRLSISLWLSSLVVTTLFYVTSRQRSLAIPAVCLLAGRGVSIVLASRPLKITALRLAAVAVIATCLTVTFMPQKEDRYVWAAQVRSSEGFSEALRLARQGMSIEALRRAGEAATWLTGRDSGVPREYVAEPARSLVWHSAPPQRRFDCAVSLIDTGDAATASTILSRLAEERYAPRRENRVVSSVSYHLARAELRLDRRENATRHIAEAMAEAPGDPFVLGLAGVSGEGAGAASAMADLRALHDPFTVDLATAVALADVGRSSDASATAERLRRRASWWSRAQRLQTANGPSSAPASDF